MATTLRDVAKRAGVSIATASRAINSTTSHGVARGTRERILEVAQHLDYPLESKYDRLDTREGGTANIGLVLDSASNKFTDPFWTPVLGGVDTELTRHGYHLHVTLTTEELRLERKRRWLDHAHVDGVIFVGGMRPVADGIDPRRTVAIEGGGYRIRWDTSLHLDVIAYESRRSMYQVVDHLVTSGRRRLAVLGPPPERDERSEAILHALAGHGLSPIAVASAELPWPESAGADEGYAIAARLLDEHAGAVDALVCCWDTLAVGAIRAAKDRGLCLPDDLAITGFDDIPFARDLDPALTTVHVPKALMGELAARKIIERLGNPDLPPVIQTVPTALVVRASSGTAATTA